MRRTMETIATERLNKIGKNPNLVPQRHDLHHDLRAVNELLILSAQSPETQSDNDDQAQNANELRASKRSLLPRPKSDNCFRFNLVNDLANLINEATNATQFANQISLQPSATATTNLNIQRIELNNINKPPISPNRLINLSTANENDENNLNEIDQQPRLDRLSNAYERRRSSRLNETKIVEETVEQQQKN